MEETTQPQNAMTFCSAEINEIAAALSAFQGAIPQPKLNKEVAVRTKTGGTYKFKYADLSGCVEAAAPVLKAHGLAVTQIVCAGMLTTILMHKSGQWIKSALPINYQGGDYQALGSAITYLKRYSYCAILGIVADADDDANAACGNEAEVRERSVPKPTFTAEMLTEAMSQLECCNTKSDVTQLWNTWKSKAPAMCVKGGQFFDAVAKKANLLPES